MAVMFISMSAAPSEMVFISLISDLGTLNFDELENFQIDSHECLKMKTAPIKVLPAELV